ncbi:MAG: TIR domain-containing protein [Hyphomicrobiales bacterium]|nr:TIR domain-containing protein [Hyphomicrobiales bacterium]
MGSGGDYDVFISYAHSDGAAAADLSGWLSAQGLRTFFDRNALRPGLRWVPALEDAIGRSKAVAILVGKHGIGNTQQYERELALVRQTGDAAFPVIPVLMPGCDSPPTGFLRLLTWVDFSKGANVGDQSESLEALRAALRGEDVAASAIRASICPYRGLEPFREEDAAFFCGRDDAIRELVARVKEHEFVVVVGPSGSGKSSLVFAGLLPALRKQSGTTMWDVVALRPGKWPLRALAQAFGTVPDNAGSFEIDAWLEKEASFLRAGDADALGRAVDRRLDSAPEKPDRLLIYVDQWEELYAMAPAPEDKERFTQHLADVERFIALLASASCAGSRANVVMTVRADFYNPLIRNPLIAALLPKQQVNIPPMSRDDLRSAIETPAKTAGLSFSPKLVDRILDDVGLEEGRLPLLQFALKETWGKRRQGDRLTAEAYTEVGGVAGAIEKTAEDAYEGLKPEQKDAARRLFLRLVTPGEGQADTRARSAIPDDPDQRDIVSLFANPKTRLLVTGYETLQGAARAGSEARSTVEVAHEALIQRWTTLRDWVRANRENMRARAAILRAHAEWEEHGESDKFLLDPGVQLERGRALLANPGDVAVDDVRDYVGRSIEKDQRRLDAEREAALADQKRVADAERQAREAAEQAAAAGKRTARVALGGLAAAILVAAVAIWQYFVADQAKTDAFTQREAAIAAGRVAGQAKKDALAQRDRAVQAEEKANKARQEAQANAEQALQEKQLADAQRTLALFSVAAAKSIAGQISGRLLRLMNTVQEAANSDSSLDREFAYLAIADYFRATFDHGFARDTIQKVDDYIKRAPPSDAVGTKFRFLQLRDDEIRGDIDTDKGTKEADQDYGAALAILERADEAEPEVAQSRARLLRKIADLKIADLRLANADLQAAGQTLEAAEVILNRHSDEPWAVHESALLNVSRAEYFVQQGKLNEARPLLAKAIEVFGKAHEAQPLDNPLSLELATTLQRQGDLERQLGDPHALTTYNLSLDLLNRIVTDDPASFPALSAIDLTHHGIRLLKVDASINSEHDPVKANIDHTFGAGLGKFHFGMRMSEANQVLHPPFNLNNLDNIRASEYVTADVRYLWKSFRDETDILPFAQIACLSNSGYFVLFFHEDRLFRAELRFFKDALGACNDEAVKPMRLIEDFANKYQLTTTGSLVDRTIKYETQQVSLRSYADSTVVFFIFTLR